MMLSTVKAAGWKSVVLHDKKPLSFISKSDQASEDHCITECYTNNAATCNFY